MRAITRVTGTFVHVPECDREKPVEEQTRFHLRALTQGERMQVIDDEDVVELRTDGQRVVHSRLWSQCLDLALHHIVRVEHFCDDEGREIPWPADGTLEEKRAFLARIEDAEVFRIGAAVRNQVTPPAAAGN